MADVVIVGGGVIGCSTAYYLARAGAKVTVIERGEIAGEASGAAAGMLAALSGEAGERGPAFDELCADSANLYDKLLPELEPAGSGTWHWRTGILHVALDAHEASELRERFETVTALGVQATWLDRADLHSEEPELNASAAAGYVTSGERYVDPRRLTQVLAEASRRLGVTIVENAGASRMQRRGGRIGAVATAQGTFSADSVLLACGPWTAEVAARLHARIPVYPVRGQMLSLEGPPVALRHMIWGGHAYLVPREDNQTYVGATVEDVGYRKRTTDDGIGSLRRGAAGLVPALRGAAARRVWAGLRPASADGLPIMGRLPGWENVWVSTGHFRNGILLAPISGQLVAKSIVEGEADSRLAPFTPERFLD